MPNVTFLTGFGGLSLGVSGVGLNGGTVGLAGSGSGFGSGFATTGGLGTGFGSGFATTGGLGVGPESGLVSGSAGRGSGLSGTGLLGVGLVGLGSGFASLSCLGRAGLCGDAGPFGASEPDSPEATA